MSGNNSALPKSRTFRNRDSFHVEYFSYDHFASKSPIEPWHARKEKAIDDAKQEGSKKRQLQKVISIRRMKERSNPNMSINNVVPEETTDCDTSDETLAIINDTDIASNVNDDNNQKQISDPSPDMLNVEDSSSQSVLILSPVPQVAAIPPERKRAYHSPYRRSPRKVTNEKNEVIEIASPTRFRGEWETVGKPAYQKHGKSALSSLQNVPIALKEKLLDHIRERNQFAKQIAMKNEYWKHINGNVGEECSDTKLLNNLNGGNSSVSRAIDSKHIKQMEELRDVISKSYLSNSSVKKPQAPKAGGQSSFASPRKLKNQLLSNESQSSIVHPSDEKSLQHCLFCVALDGSDSVKNPRDIDIAV